VAHEPLRVCIAVLSAKGQNAFARTYIANGFEAMPSRPRVYWRVQTRSPLRRNGSSRTQAYPQIHQVYAGWLVGSRSLITRPAIAFVIAQRSCMSSCWLAVSIIEIQWQSQERPLADVRQTSYVQLSSESTGCHKPQLVQRETRVGGVTSCIQGIDAGARIRPADTSCNRHPHSATCCIKSH
jgi:hypothetical protein